MTAWEGTPSPDITVANHGSIFTFTALTERAKEWIEENVQTEDYQWFGSDVLCVEHRYAPGLAEGMELDGLVVLR